MSARYILRVTTEFAAAHVLRGYDGACARIHGHNWRVEVRAQADAVGPLGMAIDFRELTSMTEAVTAELDHQLLNDIPPFTEVNPTAENVAAYVYRALARALAERPQAPAVRLVSVTIHENDRLSVEYAED
ncbi:MAG: 6-carboxytetrahydropterin synthase QueD [Myxococcota bacterium]